jgi:hypothetical protein
MIKFKGQVIHSGPVGRLHLNSNWNNSMGQYYPVLTVECVGVVTGLVERHSYGLDIDGNETQCMSHIEATINQHHADMLNQIDAALKVKRDAENAANEAKTVRVGKEARIFKGRKYPVGTVGRVFWTGETKYGSSTGLELNCGKRIFVNTGNLEVIGMAD